MALSFDDALGIHADAMTLRSQRAEVLAANVANADTPGYKARDFNFRDALLEAESVLTPVATRPGHADFGARAGSDLLYRVPLQPALDGNTVDGHIEKAEFMKNSMLYSASLSFLNSRINGLISAVRGE